MFTYFIAGVPKCQDFGHAKLVAEKLRLSLPRFSYKIIVKTEEEYQDWMNKFCLEQKWKINKNPLVWKRVPNSNGSCHLIGGINEFFDHLIEYYNVDTRLDKRIKKQIALDNEKRLPFMLTEQKPVCRPVARKVCITGAVYPSTCYLVSELLQLKQLQAESGGGVSISLHHKNSNNYGDLIRIKNEICDAEFNVRGCSMVTVVNSVEEGLLNCDLLIVIGSMKRGENEDQDIWTNRNFIAMKSLASILNRHCPVRCKVLLMSMDLLCFNLSVLAENAEKVYLYNIVGVTGHHGIVTLPTISRVTSIPISDLHCPPVWGFDGSAQYIDFKHVIYHCGRSGVDLGKPDYYDCEDAATVVHNYSADRNKHKYLQNVLLQSESLQTGGDGEHGVVNTTIESNTSVVCHLCSLPEIRVAVRMISEWFKNDSRVTISAAVFSDGTFGLPFGIFISQPVCMENGEWKPNFDFPSPDETIIIDILSKVEDITFDYNLGKRFNVQYPARESRTNIFDE
ncbi:putative malate dehydrogenase 1B [Rhopalosiphum maidis]|uniref:putative malate dehydrogenase 1B n=1 Tax=Rhopalosiphum maidis TaxID=43146 RepID=UPI000EFEB9B4|nr:putative malate dehydrogenase 1B [Rhopalosiphum maidis]